MPLGLLISGRPFLALVLGSRRLVLGTLTLTNANNTYSGDTTISGGTLALANSGGIASSPNIIVEGSGTFDVLGPVQHFDAWRSDIEGAQHRRHWNDQGRSLSWPDIGEHILAYAALFCAGTPALTVSGWRTDAEQRHHRVGRD